MTGQKPVSSVMKIIAASRGGEINQNCCDFDWSDNFLLVRMYVHTSLCVLPISCGNFCGPEVIIITSWADRLQDPPALLVDYWPTHLASQYVQYPVVTDISSGDQTCTMLPEMSSR